jgi:hypothetical protein
VYKQHATKVQAYAQQSADNMAWVILLVICSIRMNWLTVGDQLKDIKELKHDSRFLKNRTRAKAYKYISAHKHKMYGQMMAVINSHKNDNDDRAMSLMKVFIRVPGLGLAKAGFVCQLCVGLVGCIDSHNLKLYGLDPRCLDYDKSIKNQALLAEKKRNYIEICHSYGTEFLWNKWCEHVATGSPHWIDGDHVSAVHYTYLKQGA